MTTRQLKKLAVIYGFLVWLIPFIIAFFIFPLKTSDRPFFESIMPVTITITTMIFTILYFKKIEKNYLKQGIFLGIIFLAISIIIDLLMFSKGPMAMAFLDYIKDIGFTYLIIPIITIGIGYFIDKK